uniref:Uncharacterized protein n=1 Tax=Araucaria cunninghamii TaxID=56994 RepID=A0A0D6QY02_ARACU
MSVIGLDIGNENCVVAVAKQRGIDVVLNEESKRETPTVVSFGEKQRFLGTAAAASATMNPKSTVSQVKRLIGRRFDDPEVQNDLRLFPFRASSAPDGGILIHVDYLGEIKTFTPTQILGMILSNLKQIAVKNLETTAVSDCVIGIPAYFTDLQRRAYLDAAAIAKLKPLRLMHESAAIALSYGIYKTDLPENRSINVVFVDIGHCDTQVSVAAFKKGQLLMLSHAFDRSLGGRDFDDVLYNYFAKKFKQEYKIDVSTSSRASLRLRAACEKLKKVLSANAEAPLNIECLMEEKDVRGFIKRDEFEKLSSHLLERVKAPCQRALDDANLSIDEIYSVEVVGSGSRIPAILKILGGFFRREPSRTLNASECIARGCALQCAMLSPTFRVREFQVQDSFPFSVALCWKGPASEADEGSVATQPNSVLFRKGNPIPSTKMLTFFRNGTFTLDAVYADTKDLPPRTPSLISTFIIGPFQASKLEKIKVKIRLNLYGIVTIESASLIDEEEVEVPVTESSNPGETEKNKDGEPSAGSNVDGAGNGHAVSPGSTTPAVNSAQREVVKKKRYRRTDLPVNELINGGLPQAELQKALDKEFELAHQDKIMEETKDKKNAVESYVYEMRNKLLDIYHRYATDSEREELSRKLQQTEDWLYEEGDDESKGVYTAKLEELKKIGDLIEQRYKEERARAQEANELMQCIHHYRNLAQSKDPKFEHIEPREIEKVIFECTKTEDWLKETMQQQDAMPKSSSPILRSVEIGKKIDVLDRYCKQILSTPKPKPIPKSGDANDPKQNAQSSDPMDIDDAQDPQNM